MTNSQSSDIDCIKKIAVIIIKGLHYEKGRIIIDVDTRYNSAVVSAEKQRKRIDEGGDEVFITEKKAIK